MRLPDVLPTKERIHLSPIKPIVMNNRWLLAAALGMILFVLIQVFPVTGQMFQSGRHPVLDRTAAEQKAVEIASERFGVRGSDIVDAVVTHLSDSDAVGYFSKNGLLDAYNKQWSGAVPTDFYRVDLQLGGQAGTLMLSLHLETGKLVAWSHRLPAGRSASSFQGDSGENIAAAALSFAEAWGVDRKDWAWSGTIDESGAVLFESTRGAVGEAQVALKVSPPAEDNTGAAAHPAWAGGSVTYGVKLPETFTTYLADQEKLASKFSNFGFIVPHLILFVCAIVYTGTHGGLTAYRRGVFLALLFFLLYVAITINMIPGLRAGVLDLTESAGAGTDTAMAIVSIVIYAGMALLTYFCAVAGDGLWKSMGKSLWPRWQEARYGADVLQSMKDGYFLAFILLGVQSVVLLILEKTLGSFASSDPTQSMYNMSLPWLLPLLAWCAGISEELQSRFFGIALFRKWLLFGTRKLLRREPSSRTITGLTFAAMIPPGLLWAFGHVGYAIYPVYTRIIELVIMAVLFGWFMLRFGLMAVIFAHVTLNATLMGVQLMFDGLPGDYWGGLFSLIMPALAGIAIWWLHGLLRQQKRAS